MQIRVFPPIQDRPCRLCLALQNDSVFADFDASEDGRLYLVAISFDGYGFCDPEWDSAPHKMSAEDSRRLLALKEHDHSARQDIAEILRVYFAECAGAIWTDALQKHKVIAGT